MPAGTLSHLDRADRVILGGAVAAVIAVASVHAAGAGDIAQFVTAGVALAALAALVGQSIEQLGERLGPGPTGLIQSTLGNLPELFVGLFALRDGLTNVVRSALVGSVLGNAVLVLGMAFVAGGIRHGSQKFNAEAPRLYSSLLLLVVAALVVPTLASTLRTPAASHATALSNGCAVVLLVVYVLSVPFYLRHGSETAGKNDPRQGHREDIWPLGLSVVLLALASAGAALAANWFVDPLQKATSSLGLSQSFTGLVVVAIASNAVENVVGIRFALHAKPDYAISTSLNSPLQVALLLTPALVLLSNVIGPSRLTLVFPPLLVVALAMSVIVVTVVIYDGEYTWLEGVALIGLYCITVSAFWWG
jgi:Ca2+:H+ antiporter